LLNFLLVSCIIELYNFRGGDIVRKLLKPFFSKKIFGVLFFLFQIALLVLPIAGVYERRFYLDFVIAALSGVVILFEINRETDSGFKLIWIAIIALFPVFGIFLYIYVHADIITRFLRKRLGVMSGYLSVTSHNVGGDIESLREEYPEEYGIFNYLAGVGYAPCFKCSDIDYYPLGEDMFASLFEDISKARKYIFLEFFIINEKDEVWNRLLDVLSLKVRQGVEVRIIYDAMGSLTCTSSDFSDKLCSMGIKCRCFSPVKPFASTYHNNRDHRKMVVIDGKIAYTGGVNIADEYINKKQRFGHWKDTAVRTKGDAVNGFVLLYFKIWNLANTKNEEYPENYFSKYKDSKEKNGYITPFDDAPIDNEYISRNLYLYIINSAKDYVYINTPYLILDDAITQAIKFAAARGVKVVICMPHIPDKWYAFALGRTYYPELIRAGVTIYEYTPGFLHAKSTVSDDSRAYIGSANYDFRSLYLHYECGVYIYRNKVVDSIKKDFETTLSSCMEFTMEEYKKLGFLYRITGRILRLFAALM